MKQTNNKNLKIVSLFTGCGGMDLGFEGGFQVRSKSINSHIHPTWMADSQRTDWVTLPKTCFSTIFANDIVPAAKAAWVPFFEKYGCSKENFHLGSIVDLVKAHKTRENILPLADVVTGGFPCQDFSVAGKRNGFNSHKGHHGKILTNLDSPTEERWN